MLDIIKHRFYSMITNLLTIIDCVIYLITFGFVETEFAFHFLFKIGHFDIDE